MWIQRRWQLLPGMITAIPNKGHLIVQTRPFTVSRTMSAPFASDSSWRTLPRHHRAYIIAARLDRPLPGRQLGVKHVPDMNHFGPDL